MLGTDNQNVLAWSKRWYSKKGASLILTQETSREIAVKRYTVEPYYLRSGHNFSADWLSRTKIHEVTKWAEIHGFKLLCFQPYWDEWMSNQLEKPLGEVTLPFLRTTISLGRTNIRLVEWNGAGTSFAVAAERFGVTVEYLHSRHEKMARQLGKYRSFEQYQGGHITLMGGSAKTEDEVAKFLEAVELYKPGSAILITPIGVEHDSSRWERYGLVDSTRFGDVIGSLWRIGAIGFPSLKVLAGPLFTEYARTIGDRYLECGIHAVGDPRGIVENHALQYSSGVEVKIRSLNGDVRLSLNSCIGVLSLADVRNQNPKWPQIWGMLGESREVHLVEQCLVLGNLPNWKMITATPEALVDTIWRSTPSELRMEIIGDVIDGFHTQPPDPLTEDFEVGADRFSFEEENPGKFGN